MKIHPIGLSNANGKVWYAFYLHFLRFEEPVSDIGSL
jgi:hypothetical protein